MSKKYCLVKFNEDSNKTYVYEIPESIDVDIVNIGDIAVVPGNQWDTFGVALTKIVDVSDYDTFGYNGVIKKIISIVSNNDIKENDFIQKMKDWDKLIDAVQDFDSKYDDSTILTYDYSYRHNAKICIETTL